MKQFKKLLCILLVVLMAFSSISIGVSAAYSDYKTKPAGYDVHGDPVISSAQRASMLLDWVDALLAEKDMDYDYDYVIVKVHIDLRSIDRACSSIYNTLNGNTYDLLCKLGAGDLEDINARYLSTNRRTTAGITDIDMLYTVIQFANDNSAIIKKFLTGNLDLGKLANMFVSLDSPEIASKALIALYNGMVDKYAEAVPGGYSADQMLQTFVNTTLLGGRNNKGEVVEGKLPSMKGKTSLTDYSLYQFIENAANAAMTDLVYPMLDTKIKSVINEAIEKVKASVGEDKASFITDNINTDFTFNYTWGKYSDKGIFGELNHFVYCVVNSIWTGKETLWVDGDNSKIKDNLGNLIKIVYEKFGEFLLPANADVLPANEVKAMSTEEAVTYIAKLFVEDEFGYVLFTDSNGVDLECKDIEQLACYALAAIAAEIVPEQNYLGKMEQGLITAGTDLAIQMGTDIGIYYLNAYTPIDVPTGLTFEASLKKIVDWALGTAENYLGIFATCGLSGSDTVWQKIDKTIFKVLPLSLFGGNISGSQDLIMNHFFKPLFDLNFEPILSLFYKNSSGPLNKTALNFVVWFLNNFLGVICAGRQIIPSSCTTLSSILTDDMIGNLIINLLQGFVAQGKTLWSSLVQFITPAMGLEDDLPYLTVQPAAGYPTKTINDVNALVEKYGNMLGNADDEFDLDVTAWNHKTDFDLCSYRYFDKAIDEAEDLVKDYNAAVLARQAAKTDDEIAAADAELATFTSAKITKIAYAVEYYYGKLEQREACTTQLDYVITLYQNKGYNKNNFSKEVWERVQNVVKFANKVSYTNIFDDDSGKPYLKQSMVNSARRSLIDAMTLLNNPMANYSELDKLVSEIEKIDLSKYTEATKEELNKALDAAKKLSRILGIGDQDIVDKALAALDKAFKALEEIKDPEFKFVDSKVVFDTVTKFVHGLKENLSEANLEKSFIAGENGGQIKVINSTGSKRIGTGTKIQLLDETGTTVLDEMEAVIFGDITGDGVIDASDIINFDIYWVNFEDSLIEVGSSNYFAFDLNKDEIVTDADVIEVDRYINYISDIDQQNPYVHDVL